MDGSSGYSPSLGLLTRGQSTHASVAHLSMKLLNCYFRFARDYRWSETGDKYIVKLFRDHVFHGVDENGRPVVSLSHVLMNLNKVRGW
jgi:hypothetical protein